MYTYINLRNTDAINEDPVESRLGLYLERSEFIRSCLTKICQPDKSTYLDKICTTFMREKSMECIESDMKKVDTLQGLIRRYKNAIISLSGIGAAYMGVKEISQAVQMVLGDLEDISCAALLGVDEVENMWNARKFLYQVE